MKYYEDEEEFSQEDDSDDEKGCGGEERKVGSQGKPASQLQAITSSGISKSKTLGDEFMMKAGSGSESTQN